MLAMIRSYAMCRALRFFSALGLILVGIGALPVINFLVLLALGQGCGNIQPLVLGGVLIILGMNILAVGLLADAAMSDLSSAA